MKFTREPYGRFVLLGVHEDGGASAYRIWDPVDRRFIGDVYASPEQPRAALKARVGTTTGPGAMKKLLTALVAVVAAPLVVIVAFFWVWWVLISGLVGIVMRIAGHGVRMVRGTQTDEHQNEARAAVLMAHMDGTPEFLLVAVVGTIIVCVLKLAINVLFF